MKTTTRLSLAGMKKNRMGTILTGIAILLTTMLLAVVGFGGYGMLQNSRQSAGEMYGEHYGTFTGLSKEQLQNVELHAQLYNIGRAVNVASVNHPRYKLTLRWQDSTASRLQHFSLQSGNMPVEESEIAACREFFQAFGLEEPKIGDTVQLPYRINGGGEVITQAFTICGFADSTEAAELSKAYSAYVSQKFMEQSIPEEQMRALTVYFQVKNEDHKDEAQMKEYIQSLAQDLGIKEQQYNINTMYLMFSLDPGTETLTACIIIMAVIVLFSVLVIYNIFHVAVVRKIKEYGRLKAIGASRRQLRQIVRREGILLSIVAIPVGLLAGMGLVKAFLFWFTGLHISTAYWQIAAGVAVLAFASVMVSVQKPLKMAAKISPVEAMRYESGRRGKSQRAGRKQLTLLTLTLSNLARNKKRTVTTILTMGLSCVLFVVVSNVVSNMDAERQVRQDLEYGRFRIELDARLHDSTYPEREFHQVQKQQPFGEAFLEEIREIPGVTDVRTRKIASVRTKVRSEKDDSEGYDSLVIVDEEEFEWLVQERANGVVDYETTAKEQGCIYMHDHWMETFGYKIGDTYSCDIMDGDRKVPFSGKILGSCGHSNDAGITITEDTYRKLGIEGDLTAVVFVDCDEKDEARVSEELESLLGGREFISVETYANKMKQNDFFVGFMRNACYAFLVILGAIGFMNLANTMITSIITRKREFGILQAIGMSNRQFKRMLQAEGMIFTVGTLTVALTLGNLLGYWAFAWCRDNGWFGLFSYRPPLLELTVMTLAIALLQVVLSWILSRNVGKESIVDRIRYHA